MTWLVRPCPRCGGSLYRERDRDRDYIVCLQCCAIFPLEAGLRGVSINKPSRRTPSAVLAKAHRPSSRG